MLFLSFLTACLPQLGRHEAPEDEPFEPTDALSVSSITPGYSSTLGGGEAEILGGPFDGSVSVTIGGNEAEVLSIDKDRLIVELPPASEGMRDVEVMSDLATGELDDAIRYFEDGTGLAGTVGAIEWYELQGTYWTEDSADFGSAWWGLTEPSDVHYWSLFGVEEDSCVAGADFPSLRFMDTGLMSTSLEVEGQQIELEALEDRTFDSLLGANDYLEYATYGVEVSGGELPDFEIPELARTGAAFDLYAPYVFGSAPPQLKKNELDIEWGQADADRMIIWVERYDQDLTGVIETVACVVRDDGQFKVPGSAWEQDWDYDQWLYIYVGAVREDGGTVPLNNADSRVAGVYWLLGAASTTK